MKAVDRLRESSSFRSAPNIIFWVAVAVALVGVVIPFFWAT